jgi:hypothetical protein
MGLTKPRAYQIFDIDYKQSVRVVTVSNVTLSGGAPSQVDGVTLSLNDRVLVTGQSTGSQNGLYYVTTVGSGSNGTWARSQDGNQTGEIEAGMIIMVTEGNTYADTQWKLTTNDPIVIGSSDMVFVQNYSANSITSGTSNVVVANNSNVSIAVAGSNIAVFSSGTQNITGNIIPTANVTYDLGSATNRFKDLYLANNSIFLGNVTLAATSTELTVNGATVITASGSSTLSLTGNITGGNLISNAAVIATGNVSGGNITTAGQVAATGNVSGGNLTTVGQVVATGNITGGNVNTAGVVRATGDLFGKELWSTQSSGDEGGQINLSIPATGTSLTGQVTIDIYQNRLRFFQGNNAKGAYIDLTATADSVGTNLLAGGGGGTPGGANTNVQFNDDGTFGGNANFTYDKFFNTVNAGTFAGTINGLGQNFKVGDDAWIGDINIDNTIGLKGQQNAANCYIIFGNSDATGKLGRSGTGPLTYTGDFSATGNVSGNFFIGNGSALTGIVAGLKWTTVANTAPSSPAAGDFWYDSFSGVKYQFTNDGTSSSWVDQSFPTVFTTLTTSQILNGGASGTGNIGTAGGTFNTVFAKATSAQYADLAEIYSSDADYPPGTVVVFGGDKEVTVSTQSHDTRVAGVISTNPAYIMNSLAVGVPVAFTGRVPCQVLGPVNKGDVLVTSTIPGVAQRIGFNYQPGCVIGKSLENIEGASVKTIEVVVGRF